MVTGQTILLTYFWRASIKSSAQQILVFIIIVIRYIHDILAALKRNRLYSIVYFMAGLNTDTVININILAGSTGR